MKRRDLLAGAAALPVAGLAANASASADPAVEAARRWIAAASAEEAFAYDDERQGGDWDDDPHAVELTDEERRCWQAMLDTPPSTGEGLALMLACFIYRTEGQAIGSHFSDPESWHWGGTEGQGILYALLPLLWESPAAAELFPQTTPPCDAAAIVAKVEAEREARIAGTA